MMGPDIDNNGTESVLSLGTTNSGANVWLAQDTRSGVRRRLGSFPPWMTPISLTTISDPNGDDKDDVVLLAETPAGSALWRRISTATVTIQRQGSLPGWFSGEHISSISDINDNGEPDLMFYGTSTSGTKVWVKADGFSGTGLGSIALPQGYEELH